MYSIFPLALGYHFGALLHTNQDALQAAPAPALGRQCFPSTPYLSPPYYLPRSTMYYYQSPNHQPLISYLGTKTCVRGVVLDWVEP